MSFGYFILILVVFESKAWILQQDGQSMSQSRDSENKIISIPVRK